MDNLKVLYLEDEPIVAMDTSAHLEDLGFEEVAVAYRLGTAEKLAESDQYDLAILDINVDRGQTSLELGSALAAKGTRVIFASGNGCDAATLRAQGFEFLDKPFSLDGLTHKLKALAAE